MSRDLSMRIFTMNEENGETGESWTHLEGQLVCKNASNQIASVSCEDKSVVGMKSRCTDGAIMAYRASS